MAEQEVVKHTKKIYKIWTSKEHGFWHKVKEFVLEILIIVFAVTLSIWLHERSEHKHQQQDVKEFLLGLKLDLQNDLKEMGEDRKTYLRSKGVFNYLTHLGFHELPNLDSLRKYDNALFNQTGLSPNNGRFEGFKSAGKIGTIENKTLQNDIMDLYQENIPVLIIYTNYYSASKQRFTDYYNENYKRFSRSSDNYLELLATDKARSIELGLSEVQTIIDQYDKCMGNIKKIITEIDKEYKD